MAITLKLNNADADLTRRVLMALVAKPDACDLVLRTANVSRPAVSNATTALVRIANYIETVEKAG